MPTYGQQLVVAIDKLETILAKHQDLISQIERQIVIPDQKKRDELVKVLIRHDLSPIRLLARLVGPLPASEDNHHHDDYGLYRHSLEVTLLALTKFNGRVSLPAEPTQKQLRRHARELVAVFVNAIIHDLGKILFLMVEVEGAPNPVPAWDPSRWYLLDYVDQAKGQAIKYAWMFGRMRTGFKGHEPLGAWYFTMVTPPTLLKYLGAEQANNTIACMARSLGGPIGLVPDLVKEADLESSMQSIRARRASLHGMPHETAVLPQTSAAGALAPIVNLPPLGKGSRIEDFLVVFRKMAADFTVNRLNADLYCSPSHTIIPIGTPERTRRIKGGGLGNVLRRVAEKARNLLHMDPTADKMVKDFYLTSEGNKYLHPLAELSGGAASWCVPSVAPSAGQTAEIRHYLTVERGRAAAAFHETPVIIIRNEVLWGEIDPTTLYGLFTEPILLTDPQKEAESVDPETLGFRAFERPLTRQPTPAPHEERTVTATSLAYRTWLALNRIAPYESAPLAIRSHYDALGSKLVSPSSITDEHLLLSSLEAIAERLDDVVARGGLEVVVEALKPESTPKAVAKPLTAKATAASVASSSVTAVPPPKAPESSAAAIPASAPRAANAAAPSSGKAADNSRPSPRPGNLVGLLASRLVAVTQGDPLDPPGGGDPHPDSHILRVGVWACVAWPAVPRRLMPDLTEIELARILPQIAVKLNAEGSDSAWLHTKRFPTIRYPEPRTDATYLVFNSDLLSSLAASVTDASPESICVYFAEEIPA